MNILVFPKSENPYQHLLYSQKAFHGDRITYLKYDISPVDVVNRVRMLCSLVSFRLKGYKVFHLHWLYNFSPPNVNKVFLLINTIYLPLLFVFIRFLGFKLIWTVHNIEQHEPVTLDDKKISKFLFNFCNTLIIHSPSTKEELARLGVDTDKCVLIPHGNYIDTYSNTSTDVFSRNLLNLNSKHFVYVFLGHLKPYKGIEDLISSFLSISSNNSELFLLIVGKSNDTRYVQSLQNMCKDSKNIFIIDKYIDDDSLQYYFNAADVVVLPFKSITTSGSLYLAFSFKKTVIAPSIGVIQDLPDDTGYYYNPGNSQALSEAMLLSYKNRQLTKMKSLKGFEHVRAIKWGDIACKTNQAFQ